MKACLEKALNPRNINWTKIEVADRTKFKSDFVAFNST